ncbi:MAG: lysophospholipid acyltransferase family protein [Chthoniobacter sp.]|uniref:lysophospholipid acyltransferase family protein n=1 Tax=Chthoniobacter sp. TaxID=2510640 RepID=UPI0032A20F21
MEDWQYKPAGDHGLKPEESLRSLRREAGLGATITQSAWRLAVRAYLRGYHRLRVEGVENVPASPSFVMVANHSSHLDAITLAAALPWPLRRFAFPIAAGDVFFETPAVALFSAMMLNALPMWRKSCGPHAMQQLRERLISEPTIYVLFPEGTRSRDGNLGRFKPGLGMIVAGSEVPVVPCYLHGAHAACPADRKLPRPLPLHLRIGAPLQFSAIKNERAGWQEIAAQLEAAVTALRDRAPFSGGPQS